MCVAVALRLRHLVLGVLAFLVGEAFGPEGRAFVPGLTRMLRVFLLETRRARMEVSCATVRVLRPPMRRVPASARAALPFLLILRCGVVCHDQRVLPPTIEVAAPASYHRAIAARRSVERLSRKREDGLLRLAVDARLRAVQTLERNALVHATRRLAKDGQTMLTRCAWCDRVQLDERWMTRDQAPTLPHDIRERTSHGICPGCLAELRQSGRSR